MTKEELIKNGNLKKLKEGNYIFTESDLFLASKNKNVFLLISKNLKEISNETIFLFFKEFKAFSDSGIDLNIYSKTGLSFLSFLFKNLHLIESDFGSKELEYFDINMLNKNSSHPIVFLLKNNFISSEKKISILNQISVKKINNTIDKNGFSLFTHFIKTNDKILIKYAIDNFFVETKEDYKYFEEYKLKEKAEFLKKNADKIIEQLQSNSNFSLNEFLKDN